MTRHGWVEGCSHGKPITAGLRAFFRENRTSVLYASLSGLSVAVIALAWQGWAYVVVILLAWFAAELFLARFRNEDTMGTWILFAIALALPVILAFQWYYVRVQIRVWFDVPAYLFLAALVLGFAFTVTRDYPWTLVIPGTLIAAGVAVGVGIVVNPSLLDALVSGAGYFIPSKVVTTIAEDQSPGMSQMILSFGLFTFGMSLLAMAYLLWQVPRRRDPAYSLVVVWAFVAIFMAITGARFIFDASPAFAVTAGFAIDQVLVRADFATMRRTYRSLAAGSWRNAVRKSVKARHVLAVLGIVFLVLVPNVWWAVDASIPFDLKAQYDQQVANLLPAFLRPGYNPSSGSPFYFGAFGYSIPKATVCYPAGWQWFATQDAGTPPELGPAFLSWWDYGFEAVDRGAHPTVADNFQDGVALAGQFITAQNETAGIALLVSRLLEGDFRLNRPNFRPAVTALLLDAGLPVDTLRSVFARPQDYIPVVLNDPITFGLWASDLQPLNAQYIFLTNLLTRRMGEEQLVTLYHDIRDATGWNIGYFAVDARLFPTSAQNTGIFYAPVKLSHRVLQPVPGCGEPYERLPGDELRPGATEAGRDPGRDDQRRCGLEHPSVRFQRRRLPALLRWRGRQRDRVCGVDAAPTRLGHGDGRARHAPRRHPNRCARPLQRDRPVRECHHHGVDREPDPQDARRRAVPRVVHPPGDDRPGDADARRREWRWGAGLDDPPRLPCRLAHGPRDRLLRPEPGRVVRGDGCVRARSGGDPPARPVRVQPHRHPGERRDVHDFGPARWLLSGFDRVGPTHAPRVHRCPPA